jgi:hypothetical protein
MGGEDRCIQGNVRERDNYEDQGIYGRKLDLQHSIGGKGIDWIYLVKDKESPFERGSEPSGNIICGKFLNKLRNAWFLNKYCKVYK